MTAPQELYEYAPNQKMRLIFKVICLLSKGVFNIYVDIIFDFFDHSTLVDKLSRDWCKNVTGPRVDY